MEDLDGRYILEKALKDSISVKESILLDEELVTTIISVASIMVRAFKAGNKVLLCGNGGSAADAQHMAAELSGKFYIDREPIFAEALHVNTSYLTAVANDYSYSVTFSRMVKAMGEEGDILIGISTSGNSENVVNAIKVANKMGMVTVGMTGKSGGELVRVCDYLINVPSEDTPRIQEAHITIGHIICEFVEMSLFRYA